MPADEIKAIEAAVASINRAWIEGDYSRLAPLMHRNVVFMDAGFEAGIMGLEPCVQSYRDFTEVAHVQSFKPGAPRIQTWGDTAVAACPFAITYEIEGRSVLETGTDLLVFARDADQWRVVWRTVSSEEISGKPSD